jgi:hypothetical protein
MELVVFSADFIKNILKILLIKSHLANLHPFFFSFTDKFEYKTFLVCMTNNKSFHRISR